MITALEADESDGQPMRAALERAIANPDARDSVRVHMECRREQELMAFVAFGNGVAVWNRARQFRLSTEAITSMLVAFRDSGFSDLAESFGGRATADPRLPATAQDPGNALVLSCRVGLEIAGLTKEVVQEVEGEQSPELRQLADRLFAIGAGASDQGVLAASVSDGLAKIGRGELAGETLSLLVHRKPRLEGQGFLLHLSGLRASVRLYDPVAGYGERRFLRLTGEEAATLAAGLAASNPDRFPQNLFAQDYTDLTVEVLDRKISVQARQFARLTPATHGEIQTDFDQALSLLEQVVQRIAEAGASRSAL